MSFPSPADDHADRSLNLHDHLVVRPAATFFWRYVGRRMERAGILPGALLVVDRSLDVREGDVVVAYRHGEWLVRRLVRQGGRHRLADDPLHGDEVVLDVEEDTRIWGVVIHVVNTFRGG